jgi:tetratricopeptide (TPR) repeat protein
MFRILVFLSIIFLVLSAPITAGILDLIEEGRLDEAKRLLDKEATATLRNGNNLYFQAILEPDGDKSMQFLEAAFKAEMSPEYLEDNIRRMTYYYLAAGDYEKTISNAQAYLQFWEDGRHRAEIQRLYAYALYMRNDTDKGAKIRNNTIRENENGPLGDIGLLDQAAEYYHQKDYIKAQNICRKLAGSEHDYVVSPSLFMLSYYSLEQKRIDDAILYYNILKEGYPDAVGLSDLINRFSSLKTSPTNHDAEEITGTVYSVKAGVFSIRDNAKNLKDRLKQYGEKVEVKKKRISEKDYYVVYVGRFVSSQEAMAFKVRLETHENEVYQVVAR